MKYNLLIAAVFLSIIIYANVKEEHGIVGLTKRDGGIGCVCHDINPTDSVIVWIEGPNTISINDTVNYKLFMTGGPAVAGGFNIASYFGELDSVDTLTHTMFGELTHSFPNPFVNDTVYWNFSYIAPDSILVDTIYSVANSVNGNGNPSGDQWNFGNNFTVFVMPRIPVELVSFTANSNDEAIYLFWETATETNNHGFEIERKSNIRGQQANNTYEDLEGFQSIGFVEGNGTTTESESYSFVDKNITAGTYIYRLKQIDYNGSFEYSDEIMVDVHPVLTNFVLKQNYPNPFNPITNIEFQIVDFGFVSLKVFDVIGKEMATLINEEKPAGNYEVLFDASGLSSGIYYYRLEAKGYSQTKKMVLLK